MGEFIEAIGKVIEGGFGFRYVFSNAYRGKTRERWRHQSRLAIVFEVFEALIGMAFIIIILYAVIR
jgi:hypothetical protein